MGMRPKQKKVDTRARKQGIIKAPPNRWINKVSQMKKQVRKQRIIFVMCISFTLLSNVAPNRTTKPKIQGFQLSLQITRIK